MRFCGFDGATSSGGSIQRPEWLDRPVFRQGVGKCVGMKNSQSEFSLIYQYLVVRKWRRDGDSNPGHLSVNTISNRAP